MLPSPADVESFEGAEAQVERLGSAPEPEASTAEAQPEAEPEPEPAAKVHPAAGSEEPYPLADQGPYYIGLWSGKPNFGCPYCSFATLQGSGAVELHILEKIDQGNARHMPALNTK